MKKCVSLLFVFFVVFSIGCDTGNPYLPTATDIVSMAGCIDDIEKSEGKYILQADVRCVDGLFNEPTDVTPIQSEPTKFNGCSAPFGIDSQQILNEGILDIKYRIGVVSDINLERNDDGTWYIADCDILYKSLYFQAPYPQQHNFNDGDIIAFEAIRKSNTTWRGTVSWYSAGKFLENISEQSADCQIDDVSQLSNPSDSIPLFATKDDFVDVTGLIMAVQTVKNHDPEPDNPHDYLIAYAVMKCADGVLYKVTFETSYRADKFGTERVNVNRPSQDAFGEGDIITVKQTDNVSTISDSFTAYYEPPNN